MNAGAGNGAANGAANGSNLRANANEWNPPAGRNPYAEPYYPGGMNPNAPPPFNPNRPAEQLEEAAEMDALLEEINTGRARNMPPNNGAARRRKNRKSRKSRKSRKNHKSRKSRR